MKKGFYHELRILALPIILQNLLSAAIGSADTLMLNFIGQTELAAVSLANQLLFVLTLFFTGLTASTGIMMAQYLGKNDTEKASQIFGIACKFAYGVCVLFCFAAIMIPDKVMFILTNEMVLIQEGSKYLRIVGISYLFMGFSQIYLATLKAMKMARKSMCITVFTLLVNLVLNAVVIFGLFGLPKLGIIGVAIATCIARMLEFVVCIVDWKVHEYVSFSRAADKLLQKDFVKIVFPMTMQGFVWGGAMAIMSAIMGHMGEDAVAANSVASVIQNIATVASAGIAEAGAILLGNDLGNSQFDVAKKHAGKIVRVAVLCGVIGCIIMLLAEYPVTQILTLTYEAKGYLSIMYKILSVNVIFVAITYTMLCGVFPAGGDTRYGLYIDGIVMWTLVILGSLAAYIWKCNPLIVFIILNVDELVKTPFVTWKYYKWDWIKNVTRKEEETS